MKRLFSRPMLIALLICLNILVNARFCDIAVAQLNAISSGKTYYKYLIIVPDNASWINALEPFIEWKTREGLQTFVTLSIPPTPPPPPPSPCEPIKLTNLTEIANIYGSITAENIRQYIVDLWENNTYSGLLGRSTLRFVLLVGDVKYIPTYLYNVTIDGNPCTYATDQYYADFYYPAIDQYINPCVNKTDWGAEVYVGRFPVNTVEELNNVVNKTVTYEMHSNGVLQNPLGWERRVLFLGAIMYNGFISGGKERWKDGAFVAELVKQNCSNWWMGDLGPIPSPTTLYDTNNNSSIWYTGYSYLNNLHNLTSANIINQINNVGFSAVLSVSHGNLKSLQGMMCGSPGSWNPPFFYNENVSSLRNNYTLPFWFTDCCHTGAFQADMWKAGDRCLGEELFLANPANCGGVVAFIGCSNLSWFRFYYGIPQNRPDVLETLSNRLGNLTFYELYSVCSPIGGWYVSKWGLGPALFEAKRLYNQTSWDTLPPGKQAPTAMHMATCLGFNLLGDPSLQIWPQTPLESAMHYSISAPSTVQPGENFTVQVNRTSYISGGSYPPYGPRNGSKVCVSMVENGKVVYNKVASTYNGAANFTAPNQTGTLNLTVTDHPYLVPYLSQIQVGGDHDVAVTNVTPLKTIVGQTYNCSVNVTVANEGDFPETFNVTLNASTTLIGTLKVNDLPNGTSAVLTFTWNTSSFAKGNYTISAYAWLVPGETDTIDNTCVDGWVFITIPGDINGDRKVDLKDLMLLIKAFGSYPSHPKWNPNADINCDGKVDIKDLMLVIRHFGRWW